MSDVCQTLKRTTVPFLMLAFTGSLLIPGCGTMQNGRRWGEDATLRPGWGKVRGSALEAVFSPMVIIPAAAALILQIDDMDDRLSRWAVRHTPTTGSSDRAERLSSRLRSVALGSFYLSVLATPGGREPGAWCTSKARGLALQGSALAVNNGLVFAIKEAAERRRPDGSDLESFPSGHASNAAAFTALSSRNVETMDMPVQAQTALCTLLLAVMVGTAWERVEAGVHYPSDVLAGMAMGYFTATFLNDAFMGINDGAVPAVEFGPDGIFIGLSGRF